MKKILSLFLVLILTFSMGTLAFAEEAVALTKDEAIAKAFAHIDYDSEVPLTTIFKTETYNHDAEGIVDVYNISSTLILKSGSIFTYNTILDKYSGVIYYQKATRSWLDITAYLYTNIDIDTAYSVALDALSVNKDNTVVLTKQSIVTAEGKDAYHFVFVEGYSEQFECTVMKSNGAVEDIKISKYSAPDTNSGISGITNILERIVLFIKVLIARINPANLLDKISATDLLKVFQFLAG